ncbi:MAG: serine hydrolase [Bacteroidales bacterium]|jgi:CubicO group peptidase (beta-lactamase class C family)|nr:serine hydrolase [Bacteroidales bacterium]
MKKIICLLLFFLTANFAFAQSENYQKAIEAFEKNYNSGNFEVIFNSFSPEMQQSLPLQQTNEFLQNLKNQAGNIKNKEFVDFQQGTFAHYKTSFQNALFSVLISIDNQNKINGLFIKAYEKGTRQTINALTAFPKDISEIIYKQSEIFPNHTQISIAVLDHHDIKFYGIIKENDSLKHTNNKDKVFEIGSITKVLTSTVLASLVVEGKISLDENIHRFYSIPFKDNVQITFKSLANHTSGLPRLPSNLDLSDQSNPYKAYGAKELEEYLKNDILLENPINEKYSYSNLGVGLLGYTLGLSQNTTFQNLLQNRVLEKYGMPNTYFTSHHLNDRLVQGLNEEGKVVPNWDFDVLFGAGGILSTVNDLSKFALAAFDDANKELTLTKIPTFNVNENMKIGLGWHILKTGYSEEIYWHNGGTGGYSSSISLDIKNKKGIIILSNISAFNPNSGKIQELGFELLEMIEK